MPRRPKGPRLYLRAGRIDRRTGRELPAIYYIRDGQTEVSTGCGPDRLHGPDGAEAQLAAYIAAKWSPRTPVEGCAEDEAERRRDPDRLLIAEVLALYAQERAPRLGDPGASAARIRTLLAWWGEKTVAEIRRSECQAYVAWRTGQTLRHAKSDAALQKRVTDQGARRELEDLSAAVGYWSGEHPLKTRPKVWLPEKPESPRDALTRDQAARLLKASLGYRLDPATGRWKRLGGSSRANRAHLRRFLLIGLYTGTRPGVLPRLLWEESPTQAWIDLDAATIYRRGKREKEHRTKRRPLAKIPPRLLAHLKRWRDADQAAMAIRQADDQPTTNAVLHHGGQPLAGRIRTGFAGCVRDAGLAEEITPHWLRHTAATWLMEGGADIWAAAGYLGMNPKTLMDCYGHHRPDHQAGALKAMARKV